MCPALPSLPAPETLALANRKTTAVFFKRVQIGISGKFPPFKYYGATGNAQAYGFKEE